MTSLTDLALCINRYRLSPTLIPGDCILTNKLGISTRTFTRGDLVVFRNPENRRQMFVKRIVGLPGDMVEINEGELFINAETQPHGSDSDDVARVKPASRPTRTVPAGSYFVLGDNRSLSHDSRNFGFLSHGEITGVVTYLYWPAKSWLRFGSVK